MLLTSLYAAPILAKCHQKDKTLFFCKIQKSGKILEVCDKGKTLSYSFGKKGKKPELSLVVPRADASTYQWGGIGSSESYSVTIPNGDTNYSVFWQVDKLEKDYPETSGVIVEVKGKIVATINCINKTLVHNLMGVKLKPDRDEEKKEVVGEAIIEEIEEKTVKGPVFSAEVILSNKAKIKMEALNEKVIISSSFSGTRATPLKKSVDAKNPNIINMGELKIEINPNETAYFKSINFKKTTFDKVKKNDSGERDYDLVLNAYSARHAHKDNLLSCSTYITELPNLLHHKHVRLWCSLIDEASRFTQKAEVLGKEKVKYDNAIQRCFDQYDVMNNTVLAGCKEELSSEFRGTDSSDFNVLKLQGLFDTVGSYERKNDRWDFSLDETSGFYLIHSKANKKDETFLANDLEHIEGNRYAVYAEAEGIKNTNSPSPSPSPSWALIYNLKTKHYDLEVKTYDKSLKKWKTLMFPANPEN
jgi:hypothetical protein